MFWFERHKTCKNELVRDLVLKYLKFGILCAALENNFLTNRFRGRKWACAEPRSRMCHGGREVNLLSTDSVFLNAFLRRDVRQQRDGLVVTSGLAVTSDWSRSAVRAETLADRWAVAPVSYRRSALQPRQRRPLPFTSTDRWSVKCEILYAECNASHGVKRGVASFWFCVLLLQYIHSFIHSFIRLESQDVDWTWKKATCSAYPLLELK